MRISGNGKSKFNVNGEWHKTSLATPSLGNQPPEYNDCQNCGRMYHKQDVCPFCNAPYEPEDPNDLGYEQNNPSWALLDQIKQAVDSGQLQKELVIQWIQNPTTPLPISGLEDFQQWNPTKQQRFLQRLQDDLTGKFNAGEHDPSTW